MQPLHFNRNLDKVLADADDAGIWINCAWSVSIPRANAVAYVKTYDASPNAGFFEHEGKVILTHGAGKITFSQQEGNAIVDLIKAAYPEARP